MNLYGLEPGGVYILTLPEDITSREVARFSHNIDQYLKDLANPPRLIYVTGDITVENVKTMSDETLTALKEVLSKKE